MDLTTLLLFLIVFLFFGIVTYYFQKKHDNLLNIANYTTNQAKLNELSNHKNVYVRYGVANNENVTYEILKKMRNDDDGGVKILAAAKIDINFS